MSNEFDKVQHSKRIHKTDVKVKRQVNIAKEYGADVSVPHKFAKKHALNCGDSNCVMCMNPRKAFGEKTMQERKFEQKERLTERGQDGNAADC